MKRIFLSLISLLLVVSLLTSCSGKKILKTKDIVDNISATNVVLYDFISENEEFAEFSKMFTSSYATPGLYEGIIPQGLCYNFNMDWIIISGYYEDKAFPSMLMILDAKTGSLLKSVKLQNVDGSMYYGHAGGIASSGSYIFVTSDYSARTIAIETLEKSYDTIMKGIEETKAIQENNRIQRNENSAKLERLKHSMKRNIASV